MTVKAPDYEEWRQDYADTSEFNSARDRLRAHLGAKLADYAIFRCSVLDPTGRRYYQLRAIHLDLAKLFCETCHVGTRIERIV